LKLGSEGHFFEKSFDPHQSLGALDGEMEGLAIQLLMAGVKESDDEPRLAKMPPRALKHIVLPLYLFGRGQRPNAAFAKGHGLAAVAIGPGPAPWHGGLHVTDPGRARGAPMALRV